MVLKRWEFVTKLANKLFEVGVSLGDFSSSMDLFEMFFQGTLFGVENRRKRKRKKHFYFMILDKWEFMTKVLNKLLKKLLRVLVVFLLLWMFSKCTSKAHFLVLEADEK